MKRIIRTEDAPAAIGPYSQAVMVGDQLFVSGQIALDPKTAKLLGADAGVETKQILKNLGAILRAAGMDYGDVVQSTVYLTDMEDFPAMNSAYADVFQNNPPSRATVQVAGLPKNARIEMAFIAIKTR